MTRSQPLSGRELDGASLRAAAESIQSYSVAISSRRSWARCHPTRRAAVWRYHIDQYVASHEESRRRRGGALRAARAALTPTVLGEKATARERANLEAAGKVLDAVLGEEESNYITRDLGTRTTTLAGAEPLLDKLANFARTPVHPDGAARATVNARPIGTAVTTSRTATRVTGANVSTGWPMCGYFWNSPCNGMCSAL